MENAFRLAADTTERARPDMALDRQAKGAIMLWLVYIPLMLAAPFLAAGLVWVCVLLLRLGVYLLFWFFGMVHPFDA